MLAIGEPYCKSKEKRRVLLRMKMGQWRKKRE